MAPSVVVAISPNVGANVVLARVLRAASKSLALNPACDNTLATLTNSLDETPIVIESCVILFSRNFSSAAVLPVTCLTLFISRSNWIAESTAEPSLLERRLIPRVAIAKAANLLETAKKDLFSLFAEVSAASVCFLTFFISAAARVAPSSLTSTLTSDKLFCI